MRRITRSRGGGAGVLGCHMAARTSSVPRPVTRAFSPRSRCGGGLLELLIRPQAAISARTVRAMGAAVARIIFAREMKAQRRLTIAVPVPRPQQGSPGLLASVLRTASYYLAACKTLARFAPGVAPHLAPRYPSLLTRHETIISRLFGAVSINHSGGPALRPNNAY